MYKGPVMNALANFDVVIARREDAPGFSFVRGPVI
jgi:hypothetical protein